MKTYTADGYTFTEEELQQENPYCDADGVPHKGCSFKFFAFGKAKFQYKLDQLPEDERKARLESAERFARRMQGGDY